MHLYFHIDSWLTSGWPQWCLKWPRDTLAIARWTGEDKSCSRLAARNSIRFLFQLLCQRCKRFLAPDGLMWSSLHLHPSTLCLVQSLSHSPFPSRHLPFIPCLVPTGPTSSPSVPLLCDFYHLPFRQQLPGHWLCSWIVARIPVFNQQIISSSENFYRADDLEDAQSEAAG